MAEPLRFVDLLVHAGAALKHIVHVFNGASHLVLVLLLLQLLHPLIVNRAYVQVMPVSFQMTLFDSLKDGQSFIDWTGRILKHPAGHPGRDGQTVPPVLAIARLRLFHDALSTARLDLLLLGHAYE